MQDCHREVSRTLALLTALYFAGLLMVLCCWGYTPTNDGVGYIDYARQCLSEGQPYPTPTIYRHEPFVWNIGIINLTALSLWATGSPLPVLPVLCAMKALTALLTALIAQRLFGRRVATVALLLFMLYPNNWGQSTMISSEIPSTCLATAAVYAAVRALRQRADGRWLFASGLLLGVANWCRPTAPIFLLSIIVYAACCDRQRLLRHTLLLLAGYTVFIAAVGTSCLRRTGHFVYQARSYWFSMVDECYDGAAVAPHWGQPLWPEGTPRYVEGHDSLDCFQLEHIWRERSLSWLKDHPLQYLGKIPGRLYYMYQGDYDNMAAFLADKSRPERNFITLPLRHLTAEWRTLTPAQWLSLASLGLYLGLLLASAAGSISIVRQRRRRQSLPLIIVAGGTLALVLVMHGETRFKDPLMPFLFMLAAAGVSSGPASAR